MLVEAAQQRGVTHFTGTLDVSNTAATRLAQRAGARLAIDTPGVLRFALDIPHFPPRRMTGSSTTDNR
jgi:hypothetical protein